MKIFIGHYHLHPGGVTRIIDSQIKSLLNESKNLEIELICGHCKNPSMYSELDIPVNVVPDLYYMQKDNYSKNEIIELYKKLYNRLISHINSEDILHFHNVNLGKNPVLTYCLYELAQKDFKIFNHAHDFPEDRPFNMNFLKSIIEEYFGKRSSEVLYPKGLKNYQFGVINSADRARLKENNIPADQIEFLPNPVSMPQKASDKIKDHSRQEIIRIMNLDPDKLVITYPVRIIRRKNVGEIILLAELFKDNGDFLVTLPPKNPVEIEFYNKWLQFCHKHSIDNIHFEVNQKVKFETLVNGSDFCITTSIREGFGMTFMEPWLYNTPVTGRNIDYITRDFIDNGMIFPNLYNTIFIMDKESDFKDLSMEDQMDTIQEVKNNPGYKKQIFTNNQHLYKLFNKIDIKIIQKNKEVIQTNYSFENYGKKLLETYRKFFKES